MWCFVKIKKVSWCNFNQSKDLISQNFVTIRSVLYRNSSLQGWLFYIFLCRFDHWYPVVFCRFCMNFVKHRYFLMYLIHVAQTLLMFAIYLKCLRTNFSYFSFFISITIQSLLWIHVFSKLFLQSNSTLW